MDKNVSKEEARRAFKEVSKERQEEQIKGLKSLIINTLKKLDSFQDSRDKLNRQISFLKKDLEDLKEGRLDRIEERQKVNPDAARISVAKIERVIEKTVEHHHHHNYPYPIIPYTDDYWFKPWRVTWNTEPSLPLHYEPMGTVLTNEDAGGFTTDTNAYPSFTLNASVCADNSAGTYRLDHGKVKVF